MKLKEAWITALFALSGAAICVAALAHFLLTILHNRLPWAAETQEPMRMLYVAVGSSYTQGFVVGFFLSFSLAVLAVVIGNMREQQRRAAVGNDSSFDNEVTRFRRGRAAR